MSRHPKQRSALTNGARPFLLPVPGTTEAARRYKDVLDALEAERGGAVAMTVTQREAARAYAGLSVQLALMHADVAAGRPVDPEAMGQIGDRMDRQARRMGPPQSPARQTFEQRLEVRRVRTLAAPGLAS
ncbi:hypothetical protein MPPM_0768 [Methylorubrum populi]|uniref:Uncharacterized protein n=1 Tax=Methylorubrum populi TaxID=223967 RepID=A0A160PBU5_9HYPH|nr:hypothetical protein [Methylorubrum populi]BAU89373.1 hypothetical protein MPPM_0768 [Methylorubrum populi]